MREWMENPDTIFYLRFIFHLFALSFTTHALGFLASTCIFTLKMLNGYKQEQMTSFCS